MNHNLPKIECERTTAVPGVDNDPDKLRLRSLCTAEDKSSKILHLNLKSVEPQDQNISAAEVVVLNQEPEMNPISKLAEVELQNDFTFKEKPDMVDVNTEQIEPKVQSLSTVEPQDQNISEAEFVVLNQEPEMNPISKLAEVVLQNDFTFKEKPDMVDVNTEQIEPKVQSLSTVEEMFEIAENPSTPYCLTILNPPENTDTIDVTVALIQNLDPSFNPSTMNTAVDLISNRAKLGHQSLSTSTKKADATEMNAKVDSKISAVEEMSELVNLNPLTIEEKSEVVVLYLQSPSVPVLKENSEVKETSFSGISEELIVEFVETEDYQESESSDAEPVDIKGASFILLSPESSILDLTVIQEKSKSRDQNNAPNYNAFSPELVRSTEDECDLCIGSYFSAPNNSCGEDSLFNELSMDNSRILICEEGVSAQDGKKVKAVQKIVGNERFSPPINHNMCDLTELYSSEDAILEPHSENCNDVSDKEYLPTDNEDSEKEDEEDLKSISQANISQRSQTDTSGEFSTSFSSSFNRGNKVSIPIENLEVNHAKDGKGRGKVHFCYYCKSSNQQIARHLENLHAEEELVKKWIFLPKGSKERRDCIEVIRKKGDFLFNSVRDYNTGYIFPVRRPSVKVKKTGADYSCCPGCRGSYITSSLRHHYRRCLGRKDLPPRTLLQEAAKKSGCYHQDASWKMRNRILPLLTKNSVVKNVVKYDRLIILYGNLLCARYNHAHQDEMIRSHLRLLGRLVIALRGIHKDIVDLASAFHPSKFEVVYEAINAVARYNEQTEKYESPSNVTALGNSIRKCSEILKCEFIRSLEKEKKELVMDFMTIFKTKFGALTNNKVNETQAAFKRQKETKRPSASDIQTLLNYLVNERKENCRLLAEKFSISVWLKLLEVIVVYLLVYNRRRKGEMQRLHIEDFNNSKKISKTDDLYRELTENEKIAAEKYSRVEIRGKKGRNVSVLIDTEVHDAIKMLLLHRAEAGVIDGNKYIFGLPGSNPERVPEVCALMRKYSIKCGASDPETLRGTKLRKQLATKCSTMKMTEDQVDKVANFMGHDIRIHKNYYAEPTHINDVVGISQVLENANNVESLENSGNKSMLLGNVQDMSSSLDSSFANMNSPKTNRYDLKKKRSILEEDLMMHREKDELVTDETRGKSVITGRRGLKRKKLKLEDSSVDTRSKKGTKKRWTVEEQQIAHQIFDGHIEAERLPSFIEINDLKKKYNCFKDREQQVIKAWVNNQIIRNRKVRTEREE